MTDSIKTIADDIERLADDISAPILMQRTRADEHGWSVRLTKIAARLRRLARDTAHEAASVVCHD